MIKFKSIIVSLLAASLAFPASAAPVKEISREAADYTGKGSVVAVIAAGFTADHPAFLEEPPSPALSAEDVQAVLPQGYVSARLAAVWDYSAGDGDVTNTSFTGTAAASLAAGRYTGAGDTVHEDGTVTHEASFAGAAPDAQLLLFKAAADRSVRMEADAVTHALRDALRLGADAILLSTEALEYTAALRDALRAAQAAGVPVFVGAGDVTAEAGNLPVTYTDRGTVTAWANADGIVAVGAAADPYSGVASFVLRDGERTEEITFTDSCEDYFGGSFASLMAGKSLPLVLVPGLGRAEDYAGLDVRGKAAVILRGEITFAEKANYAAAAGAEAFIVLDNGSGVSRMALEEAGIPGVMVDEAAAEILRTITAGAVMEIEARPARPASFSASGITDTLGGAAAFLCAGDGVKAAIPASVLQSGSLWASLRGTFYAAASAAGYAARAAEYCRLTGADVLSTLTSSAVPVTDENGVRLSARLAGAGVISDRGRYGAVGFAADDGGALTLPGTLKYTTAHMKITLANQTRSTQTVTLRGEVTGDGYAAAKDGGVPTLSGTAEAVRGVSMYIGDSTVDILSVSSGGITLKAGESITLSVRLNLPYNVRREIASVFWNGFFLDGALIAEDESGAESAHPFTVFCGDWSAAALADSTVFDDSEAVLGECRLLVRTFADSASDSLRPLGALNPLNSESAYDQTANLVNPAQLRLGWVELELYALRDIDRISVTFYDADRRAVFSREMDGAEKYLRGGKTNLPLWDFIAADNDDYLFPDGEYTCELCFTSSFGGAGDAVQYMGFTFTVDSEKPRVNDITVWRDDARTYLTVQVSDNAALFEVSAYDTVYSYNPADGGNTLITSLTDSTVMTFDVTHYDSRGPLYIEVTDRTGSYATVRISPEQFEALLAAGRSTAEHAA